VTEFSSLSIPTLVLIFAGVGFLAQMIDGALGMAYGVSSNALLLTLGIPPAIASASVHAAEVFTTGISGLSHLGLKNIDSGLFRRLLLPGMAGAVAGALVLTTIKGEAIRPVIAIYLLLMGLLILAKLFHPPRESKPISRPALLGLMGGFCDAVGGGGWGPIVTTTLIARGHDPRFSIGSVNSAEFFVSSAQTLIFAAVFWRGMLSFWPVILGRLLGGALAAPFAAYLCRYVPARVLTALVGVLISILSLRTLFLSFM